MEASGYKALDTTFTLSTFQNFFNRKAVNGIVDGIGGGFSQKTLKNIYNVIHIVMESAVKSEVIAYSSIKNMNIPKSETREEWFLTINEQILIKSYVDTLSCIITFGIVFIVQTVIRKYELLVLK